MSYAEKTYHANLSLAKFKAHTLLNFFSYFTEIDSDQVSQKDKDEIAGVNYRLDEIIKLIAIGPR